MALIGMIFLKMVKNKWLIFSMLIGLVISVALVSSIPMYTQAVLQKSLIKDLENYQTKNERFTGGFLISSMLDTTSINQKIDELEAKDEAVLKNEDIAVFFKKTQEAFQKRDKYIRDSVEKHIRLPVLAKVYNYSTDKKLIESEEAKTNTGDRKYASLDSLSDLREHIQLIDGGMPRLEPVDGVYEVLVSEDALRKLDLVLGKTIALKDVRTKWGISPIKVKPVGVFTVKRKDDPYWTFFLPERFGESFLMDEALLRSEFIEKDPYHLYMARWYYAFDYHAMKVNSLGTSMYGYEKLKSDLDSLGYKSSVSIEAPSIKEVIYKYGEKSRQLIRMLWALNVPILLMLGLYLFMISKLITDREKNEMALLSSRGATRLQIVFGYLLEGTILGGVSFVLGPILGLYLTKFLGASDGFLEFTKRKALDVQLNGDAYLYALLTVLLSIVTMLVPAFAAGKTSIIDHKRKLSRYHKMTFWEKSFLDIILLGIAAYGIFSFSNNQHVVRASGILAAEMQIDPLMFLVPTLFILGSGLLLIRFYPLILQLIYTAGRRIWPPSAYAALIQIGRSFKTYHFLLVFLVMTLSVGIFSSVAARTINLNAKEKIYYSIGSTMALAPLWESDKPSGGSYPGSGEEAASMTTASKVQYYEPSFLPFTELGGVEHAAKVFKREDALIQAGEKNADKVDLMGIDPYDFGETAWFRQGLLKAHIHEYLNLLTSEPSACLISKSLSEKLGIKEGDYIQVSWPGTGKADFTVYGVIDYWPSWNPNINPMEDEKVRPSLLVGNLQYIQDYLSLEPYEVWLKLKPTATSSQVYEEIQQKNLNVASLIDANLKLVELKNNPFQLAINGAMTLGFIICCIVCFLGFLLYWILSINGRILQFGIFRAMGLSVKQLVSMMFTEQLLTSGAGVAAGVIIGLVTSRLFVPFFQTAFDAYSQVPPFKVISFAGDRMKVYFMTGTMMAAGLVILGGILARIKINQAIKLGED
ncbi:MAG: ABC transporter permease [Clostridia bacterium]|nr:ABC transporter permease [Clostridia bacterium]